MYCYKRNKRKLLWVELNDKKYPKYLPWIFALAIVFGTPYLVAKIVELGLVFKPLGYLLTAIMYSIVGLVLVSLVYEIYKYFRYTRNLESRERQRKAELTDVVNKSLEAYEKSKKEQQDQQQQQQ